MLRLIGLNNIMNNKNNKFLIALFILVCMIGVYSYFHDSKSEASTTDSSLTSSLDTTAGASKTGSDDVVTDTAFIMNLNSLKTIKIDTSLLESQPFILLKDNNIKLDPVPYGRINPFAPTSDNVVANTTNNKTVISIKANTATQISDKFATLNGSLDGATSNNVYFQYGLTQTLGKNTPKSNLSLIGNFSSNINNLTSKTTYFFRAVANVSGTLIYSDIISFNTN
jgi:hypothetical protein